MKEKRRLNLLQKKIIKIEYPVAIAIAILITTILITHFYPNEVYSSKIKYVYYILNFISAGICGKYISPYTKKYSFFNNIIWSLCFGIVILVLFPHLIIMKFGLILSTAFCIVILYYFIVGVIQVIEYLKSNRQILKSISYDLLTLIIDACALMVSIFALLFPLVEVLF